MCMLNVSESSTSLSLRGDMTRDAETCKGHRELRDQASEAKCRVDAEWMQLDTVCCMTYVVLGSWVKLHLSAEVAS